MADDTNPAQGRPRGHTRRVDGSLLEPVHDPETAEESEEYLRDSEQRKWNAERPPHHEPR